MSTLSSISHGTSVTGLIAAEANNDVCIVGVAHASTIIGTWTKYKFLLHVNASEVMVWFNYA